MSKLLELVSGEFLLKRRPNGGDVVFARSLLTSSILFVAAVAVQQALVPGGDFTLSAARIALAERLPWFAAIFAAVYAALYARFAAQWTYLAGLYNQLMATRMQSPLTDQRQIDTYNIWRAGFVEDAEDVHLALKPLYASVIRDLLSQNEVKQMFATHTPGGEARAAALLAKAEGVFRDEDRRRRQLLPNAKAVNNSEPGSKESNGA